MTTYVHRTMIVPAAFAPLARALAQGLAGEAGAGMWTTPLAAPGGAEPTHYVSAGPIEDTFASIIDDAAAMYAACQSAGAAVTLEQCAALVAASDVSDKPGLRAIEDAGLAIVPQGPPEGPSA